MSDNTDARKGDDRREVERRKNEATGYVGPERRSTERRTYERRERD